MKSAFHLICLLLATGCVESRYSQKGALDRTIELDRTTTDGAPETKLSGTTATLAFTRTTCVKTRRTYLHEHYERRRYPAQLIALLGTLVAGAAAATAIASDHEGFLWPEGMPGIQTASILVGSLVGVGAVGAGWVPWILEVEDQRVLVNATRDSAFDTIDTECREQPYLRGRDMPFTALSEGQFIKGSTSFRGELGLTAVAKRLVVEGFMDEERFRSLSRSKELDVELLLDDAPVIDTKIKLSCLDRDPEPHLFACKVSCAEKGGASRCQPRLERCLSNSGNDKALCTPMFDSCLSELVTDKLAFDTCRAECLKRNLLETCR